MAKQDYPVSNRFRKLLDDRIALGRRVILDGAVGTELDNRGADTHSSVWSGLASLDEPSLLLRIHQDYVIAGADIITANTFRTTQYAFEKAGLAGNRWQEAATSAVRIAKQAAGTRALVAGSVAPLEDCFSPADAPTYDIAYKAHQLLCDALVEAGVDVLWLETFGTIEEASAALDAANAASNGRLPVALSFTTRHDGALISGESLANAARLMAKQGAEVLSINCIPKTHVQPALDVLKRSTQLPIGVYANLGVSEESQDWEGSAYLSPDAYAALAMDWDVQLVGGCCGSTPAHIQALTTSNRQE